MRCKKTGFKIADYVLFGNGKSRNARIAEENGKFPKTEFLKLIKRKEPEFFRGLNSKNFNEFFCASEWHHTGKYLMKTNYYDTADLDCSRFYIFFELTRRSKTLSKKRNFRLVREEKKTIDDVVFRVNELENIDFVRLKIEENFFMKKRKENLKNIISHYKNFWIFLHDQKEKILIVMEFSDGVFREYVIENVPEIFVYADYFDLPLREEWSFLNSIERMRENYEKYLYQKMFSSWNDDDDDDYDYDDDI